MEPRQLRAIMLYEHNLGTSARQTAEKINTAFGQCTIAHSTVSYWFKSFDKGDTSCEDKPRSGRPVVFDEDLLRSHLERHPDATTRDLEKELGYDHSTIIRHLHAMGYHKIMSRWTPHALTDSERAARVTICESLLLQPHRQDFLRSIVTVDESWVHYNNKTRQAYWVLRGERAPTEPKGYWELLDEKQTINATICGEQLEKLAPEIATKRPKRLSVSLLQDNARPHTAKSVRHILEKLNWTVVPHPPYSPDIAPSDYLQIIRTHLGKELVIYDDHTYYCNVTSANGWKKYWRCTRGGGTRCCAARLHLSPDYKVMKIINEHRHPPPRFIVRNGVYTKIG
ncbi:histone-lysine N-methyltransferase SETMAR-like [Cydia pomonella]|uniref:histone-lysine N-methyltransferase SETMAR-like n=1 Tax=Cydia pomonella TaxID=82600 RepID=UPI002ADDE52E|nr:histone-lysine N-methyltransferase SETMAR-like [Cydia pomonella]